MGKWRRIANFPTSVFLEKEPSNFSPRVRTCPFNTDDGVAQSHWIPYPQYREVAVQLLTSSVLSILKYIVNTYRMSLGRSMGKINTRHTFIYVADEGAECDMFETRLSL